MYIYIYVGYIWYLFTIITIITYIYIPLLIYIYTHDYPSNSLYIHHEWITRQGRPLGIRLQSTTAVLGRDSYGGIMDCAKSMLRHEGVGREPKTTGEFDSLTCDSGDSLTFIMDMVITICDSLWNITNIGDFKYDWWFQILKNILWN